MSTESGLQLMGTASAEYRIEKTEFGHLVFAKRLPLDALMKINEELNAGDKLMMVAGIARALGAFMAVCAPENVEPWRKAVNEAAVARANGDAELAWLWSTDTGISSETIYFALASKGQDELLARDFRVGYPHDPDDFGRCHRLLERFPEWRTRLDEVKHTCVEWAYFAPHWPELTALYLEELPSGSCPRLYDRMQEIIEGIGLPPGVGQAKLPLAGEMVTVRGEEGMVAEMEKTLQEKGLSAE